MMEKLGRSERHFRKWAQPSSKIRDLKGLHSEEAERLVDNSAHFDNNDLPEKEEGDDVNITTIKPYYQNIIPSTRDWVQFPIQGWATMASKAIFNAAELGGISEDVYTDTHQDTPITVHKLAPGYDSVFAAKKETSKWDAPMQRATDPLQVYQIAFMDFLMGNMDRHSMNLMINKTKNDEGFFPLLALNHGDNFQYQSHLSGLDFDSPSEYLNQSALSTAKEAAPAFTDYSKVKSWWLDHAEQIKNEFKQQLEYIKDTNIKEHIDKNFDRRFSMIQMWAEDEEGEVDFFSTEFPNVIRNVAKPKTAPNIIDKILSVLPKSNPADAIKMLSSALKSKHSPALKQKLSDTFNAFLEQMDTEQLIKLYDEHRKNYDPVNRNRSLGTHILKQVVRNNDKSTAKVLLDYDRGKGKLPMFWVKRLRLAAGEEE
jgi:hypothetical protein